MTGTIIISVLESYEIVRRQVLWFNRWMGRFPDWEAIFLDDTSDPPIVTAPGMSEALRAVTFAFTLHRREDPRPWSQPCARNEGARMARGRWLLMTDIDHILRPECVEEVEHLADEAHKVHFRRAWAVLDEQGDYVEDDATLLDWGCKPEQLHKFGEHYNTFAILKEAFTRMGGYDERFCGKYGGDDTEFSNRYRDLAHLKLGYQRSHRVRAHLGVFPEPRRDVKNMFHRLRGHKQKGLHP
jgi:hypothetical protein